MIVNCPNCTARFSLPDGALGSTGRKMKCSQCGHKWHQMPVDDATDDMAAPMHADAPAPARRPAPVGAGADVPLEMEPGSASPPRRAAMPDGGDIPMESGLGPSSDDDTTDLDALADMLEQGGGFGSAGDDGDDSGGTNRGSSDLDSLINAEDPDDIPSMFASPEDDDDDTGGRKGGRWLKVAVVLLLVLGGLGAGAWFGRMQVVAWVPQAQGLYAMVGLPVQTLGAGLRFQNVAGERVVEDGVDTLIVRGFIANVGGEDREVPHLKLTLYDAQDAPVQSMVSRPPQPTVGADGSAGFRLTLENPPATARRFEVDWTYDPAPPDSGTGGSGPAMGGAVGGVQG